MVKALVDPFEEAFIHIFLKENLDSHFPFFIAKYYFEAFVQFKLVSHLAKHTYLVQEVYPTLVV
jgi:hypothetical protein